MTLRLTLALSCLFILTACSSVQSNIKETSQNNYTITASTTNQGAGNQGDSIRTAVNKASAFCAKQDKRLVMVDLNSNYLAVNVPKNYTYKTSIAFQCYPKFINAK